jgi:hypothetical protein
LPSAESSVDSSLGVPRQAREKEGQDKQHETDSDDYDDGHHDFRALVSSAQLPLLLSGFLIVAGGRATLSLNSLLLLVDLLSMPLGPLGVLLGEYTMLGRLPPMGIDRPSQLLSLRRVSVRLLTVTRCFGSEPLSQGPPPLRPPPDVSDGSRQCDYRDYDYGDKENR